MGLWDTVKGVGGAVLGATPAGAIYNAAAGASKGGIAGAAGGFLGGMDPSSPLGMLTGMAGGPAGLANALPHASPANPAASYGTPRGGGSVDRNDYNLGGSSDYAQNFQAQQQGIGQQAQNMGANAMSQANALSGTAGAIGAQGQQFMAQG